MRGGGVADRDSRQQSRLSPGCQGGHCHSCSAGRFLQRERETRSDTHTDILYTDLSVEDRQVEDSQVEDRQVEDRQVEDIQTDR